MTEQSQTSVPSRQTTTPTDAVVTDAVVTDAQTDGMSRDQDRSSGGRRFVSAAMLLVLVAALCGIYFVMQQGRASTPPKKKSVADAPAKKTGADKPAIPVPGTAKTVEYPRPNRIQMPQGVFDGGTGWLNTSGDITLKDLRGKIVIMDFWTYCCINCMHVLPDLKYLEKKYRNELVVIGVHSAKFENEKQTENIRRAIQRYEIEHPVVNDSNMIIWRKLGISSWPSLLVVDADGYACLLTTGEGNRAYLDDLIGKLVAYHKAKGTLDTTPIRFDLERKKLKDRPLRFPGKVLADPAHDRLFIADTGHNRIVISTTGGKLLDVIGSGAIGRADGEYTQAAFDHPQGMALVGETLYVADTENHLIRTVDLTRKTVSTLAGTGAQSRRRTIGGPLKQTALNSPWAIVPAEGALYIAMAGFHQIWRHKLGTETIGVYAGTGREDIIDGPLADGALAQPSGLVTDGRSLFCADSEGSAIRRIPLDPAGEMTTVAGTSDLPRGRSLFEFGDVDAVGEKARFQHPLGVAYGKGSLYVADSYNHKIRQIDLKTRRVTTLLGDGKRGDRLKPPRFSEPGGLSYAGGRLYIADTNNHRIVVGDLKTRRVTLLTISGLKPLKKQTPQDPDAGLSADAVRISPQVVAPGEYLEFKVSLTLPAGYKLNKISPAGYRIKAVEKQSLVSAVQLNRYRKTAAEGTTATVRVPLSGKTGKAMFELALTYRFCRDGVGGLCKVKTARWRIPVEIKDGATQTTITLSAGKH